MESNILKIIIGRQKIIIIEKFAARKKRNVLCIKKNKNYEMPCIQGVHKKIKKRLKLKKNLKPISAMKLLKLF